MRNVGLIIEAIRASMDRQTSELAPHWHPMNPSRGNCHVASLALKHYYPEALVLRGQTRVGKELHFWNVLKGVTIDLTRDQFPPAVVFLHVADATHEPLLRVTCAKRDLLISRVDRLLSKVP